jgi:hypothetical protein
MTYHLNHIQLSKNRLSGKHAIAYDIEFILSELGIRYSIYSSKGDFDSTCDSNDKTIINIEK